MQYELEFLPFPPPSSSKEAMRILSKNTALFVVPGENIETPSPEGILGHKFDYLYEEFHKRGWRLVIVTDVYTKLAKSGTKYKVSSLKVMFLFFVFAVILRFPVKTLLSKRPLSFINQTALRKTYQTTIRRVSPNVVLAIGAAETLVQQTREYGIDCIEIQHGMFAKADLEMYWPQAQYPDSFITWDHKSGQIAESVGIKPWILGHPDSLRAPLDNDSERAGQFVCVSLDHNHLDAEDPWGCIPRKLAAVIDLLVQASVPVLIRIHPNISAKSLKSKSLTKWILRRFGNVRIDNPRQVSLRESIMESVCNVTVASATWFEFGIAGKPTLMLSEGSAARYKLHSGEIGVWASGESPIVFAESETQILNYIHRARAQKEKVGKLALQNVEDFFAELVEHKKGGTSIAD